MKNILFMLLFIACGQETKHSQVPDLSTRAPKPEIGTQSMSNELENKVEIFVAFLWPLTISEVARKSVEEVLKLGRSLRSGNEKLLGVKSEFEILKCEKILAGEIIVTYEEEDHCYNLEDTRSTLTVQMLEKVNTMRNEVKSIGGEWLDSNQDFDTTETSQIDFDKNTFSIFSMGSTTVDDKKEPIPYPKLPFKIKRINDFSFLEMTFPRTESAGMYSVKADINLREHSAIFQGDLDLIIGDKTQKGIIYWQVLKKSTLL